MADDEVVEDLDAGTTDAVVDSTPDVSSSGEVAAEHVASATTQTGEPTAPTISGDTPRALLAEMGIATDSFSDDRAAMRFLVQQAQAYQQAMPLIQHGQRYIQERLAPQPAQPQYQPQPAQAPEKPKAWEAPEFDPQWMQLVRPDETTGRYIPANAYISPEIAEKVNRYNDWRRNAVNEFIQSPMQVLEKAGLKEQLTQLRQEIRQEIFQELESRQQEQTVTGTVQQWVQQNRSLLFQCDPSGQPLVGFDGAPVRTPVGEAFVEYARRGREMGVPDHKSMDYCKDMFALDALRGKFGPQYQQEVSQFYAQQGVTGTPQQAVQQVTQAAPVTPAEPPVVGKKRKFVARATRNGRQTNRGGTIPSALAPTATQNPDAGIEELMDEEMKQRGLLPRTG